MKYLLALSLLFSVAHGQSFSEQYADLDPETKQRYETIAAQIKPKLKPLETTLLSVIRNDALTTSQKVQTLSDTDQQLTAWVGDSLLKYWVIRPIRETVKAQIEALAADMVLKIPYRLHQIKAQFNVAGAQLYAYGPGNLTLVRGHIAKGTFSRGDKVIIYFKQGGPVITSIQEDVSDPADPDEAFLLSDKISPVRFVGGAAFFIPQAKP